MRIELPIETGESPEWILEKIDRFERDGGMSLWAVVERTSGRAVPDAAFAAGFTRVTAMTGPANAPARRVLERLGLSYERDTTWEGRTYALYAAECAA